LSTQPIVLLETDSNRRGDLLSNLTQSLFAALGYENFRLNVHKSGREIDVQASHRTERKRMVAECKATDRPIGGDDINKFVGALDAERRKQSVDTIGYFVSLAGFTETAIEQETDLANGRVILIDGARVRAELVRSRVVVSPSEAYATAGKCASDFPSLVPDEQFDLIGLPIGFVWIIYFQHQKERTHFALIHADGQPLAISLAENIRSLSASLANLSYLAPKPFTTPAAADILNARQRYLDYLDSECGDIQLEGLPADEDLGARKLRLERLFVPSHMEHLKNALSSSFLARRRRAQPSLSRGRVKTRLPYGDVLRSHHRIAILGLPGSGKSTLLKRLAIAYAFPDRRALIDDRLPELDVLPLLVRCRQLGQSVRSPIIDILSAVSKRSEADPETTHAFQALVSEALRSGKAMLLIDGLDEIADQGDRVAFVMQLRTFLSTYQAIRLLITSRQAGFRIVGAALMSVCDHFSLAEFDDADIERLTVAWYREIQGNRHEVIADAKTFAQSICREPRVKQLAATPLLLTTLLLVRRWVRNLPTKRTALYAKAIEVLLMTWNVEGHEPLDQDEVLPQLQYLAYDMMQRGVQRVSTDNLKEILRHARQDMPEILGFSKLQTMDLINRVELRSSLLLLSGHDVVNGVVTPMYEFRHLTFQEYLAAKAISDGTYPSHKDEDTPLSMLQSHLEVEPWREVVLLTSILVGRKAGPVIRELLRLIVVAEPSPETFNTKEKFTISLLADAIANEVQIPPDLADECLNTLVRYRVSTNNAFNSIAAGRYGDSLERISTELFTGSGSNMLAAGGALAFLTLRKHDWHDKGMSFDVFTGIKAAIGDISAQPLSAACAILATMETAFEAWRPTPNSSPKTMAVDEGQRFLDIAGDLRGLLHSENVQIAFAACWALVWISHLPDVNLGDAALLSSALTLWLSTQQSEVRYVAAWLINSTNALPRDAKPFGEPNPALLAFIVGIRQTEAKGYRAHAERIAALIVAYYLASPYDDQELAKMWPKQGTADREAAQSRHLEEIRERLPQQVPIQGNLAIGEDADLDDVLEDSTDELQEDLLADADESVIEGAEVVEFE